jgi:hypothetical protein
MSLDCRRVDGIADELGLRTKAADLENAGRGDLGRLFGEFELELPGLAALADGREFIDAAKGGLIASGNQASADTP